MYMCDVSCRPEAKERTVRMSWFTFLFAGPLNMLLLFIAVSSEGNVFALLQTVICLLSLVVIVGAVNYVCVVLKSNLREREDGSGVVR